MPRREQYMWRKYTQKPSAKEIYLFCRGVNSICGEAKYTQKPSAMQVSLSPRLFAEIASSWKFVAIFAFFGENRGSAGKPDRRILNIVDYERNYEKTDR